MNCPHRIGSVFASRCWLMKLLLWLFSLGASHNEPIFRYYSYVETCPKDTANVLTGSMGERLRVESEHTKGRVDRWQ